jgi:hypothetical protein
MRFGLRTTILALLLVAVLPVPVAGSDPRAQTRTVPATIATTERLQSSGRVHMTVPPTHIAFSWRGAEGTGVQYRIVSPAGAVSPWRRVPEAHDMATGDRHFSGVTSVDRPIALDWRPVTPRGSWMGPVTFDYLNTLDGPRAEVQGATQSERAEASPKAPDIVTRAEWGANESQKRTTGSCGRRFYNLQQIFVHHTAGSNFDSNPKATMRAIYWYHTVRRGWCDVGYNFVIDRGGTIYEGRWARRYKPWESHTSEDGNGRVVSGAHVANFNSGSVGISLMGNYDVAPIPPEMRRSLAELLAWEADRHDLSPQGSHTYRNPETGLTRRLQFIAGHRDAGQTACPGKYVYSSLKDIRRDTKAVVGAGKDNSDLSFSASPVSVGYGSDVALAGSLVDENGLPLTGRTVTLYERVVDQGWRLYSTTTTGGDGSFAFPLSPTENVKVLAVYDGDGATWGSQSSGVAVKVRHVVTLTPLGVAPGPDGTYHLPASASSIAFGGTTAPVHIGRSVTINLQRLNPDGTYSDIGTGTANIDSSGGFSFTFVRPDVGTTGTYVAVARMSKDDRHAFGASPPVRIATDL